MSFRGGGEGACVMRSGGANFVPLEIPWKRRRAASPRGSSCAMGEPTVSQIPRTPGSHRKPRKGGYLQRIIGLMLTSVTGSVSGRSTFIHSASLQVPGWVGVECRG